MSDNFYIASATIKYEVLVVAPDEYTARLRAAEMIYHNMRDKETPKLDTNIVRIKQMPFTVEEVHDER